MKKQVNKFFFFIFLFLFSSVIYSKEITVCKKSCHYKSIQSAINNSINNDTITIKDGEYKTGHIIVDKSVEIRGEGNVILNGNKNKHVIEVLDDNVIISDLIIINSGRSEIEEFAGIYIRNSHNCTLRNNKILHTTYGIYLEKANNCKIVNNTIQGDGGGEVLSGNGIHLWYSENTEIKDNILSGHRDGLYFEFSNNLKLVKNKSLKNIRYGMHFMFCNNTIVTKSIFMKNVAGIAIMYSDRIEVKNNKFLNSINISTPGILLKEINYSNLDGNIIKGGSEGIIVDASYKNNFINNKFLKNGIAIKIYGNSQENQFSKNSFRNNYFDVSTNTKENKNLFIKNYWDKYTGYDLNDDNIGDIPYRPVSIFIYWIHKYRELSILINSPIVHFLDIAERTFPYISPITLFDSQPLIKNENRN